MDSRTVTGLDDKPFGDSISQGGSKNLSDGSLHSDKESEHSFESDRSRRSFVPSSLRTGRRSSLRSTTSGLETPTFGPSSSSRASTTVTGDEELYEELSHTDHAEYGISSISPRILDPQVPRGLASPNSDSTWPALPHLASQMLRTSPSVLRQTPSVRNDPLAAFDTETSYSEHTRFDDEEPNNVVEEGLSFTPDTSVTSVEDGEVDLDGPQIAVPWARDQILVGLSFPEEYRKPLPGSNYANEADITDETSNGEYTYPQVGSTTEPWDPSINLRGAWDDGIDLAPRAGPVFEHLYSGLGKYTRGYDKVHGEKIARTLGPSRLLAGSASGSGIFESRNIDSSSLLRSSGNWIMPHDVRLQDQHKDGSSSKTNQNKAVAVGLKLYKPMGGTFQCPQTLVSLVHPKFLVSHLSRTAISEFASELCFPNGILEGPEYPIPFFLGFGPPLILLLSAFTPRNESLLRSFQKRAGKEELEVQVSLPLAIPFFSPELQAQSLDIWLDGILDSPRDFEKYIILSTRRRKGNLSARVFEVLAPWFQNTELGEPALQTLRSAFKLALTTTLMGLVPRVTSLSSLVSLFPRLSPDLSPALPPGNPSLKAPKLLTRQLKASIFDLQLRLLYDVFNNIVTSSLNAEVGLAVVLLVATVLESVRDAGRAFAKYVSKVKEEVVVEDWEVSKHENDVQRVILMSLSEVVGRCAGTLLRKRSGLAEKLRPLFNGKEKESEDCIFVSEILNSVL